MRLTRLGKVVFTLLLVVFGIFVYNNLETWGALAQTSSFYEMITLLGWGWMLVQVFVLSAIWEF